MARSSKVVKKVEAAPEKRYFIFVALKDGTTLRGAGDKVDLVSSYSGPVPQQEYESFRSQMAYPSTKQVVFRTLDGWTFFVAKDNIAYAHTKEEEVRDPVVS